VESDSIIFIIVKTIVHVQILSLQCQLFATVRQRATGPYPADAEGKTSYFLSRACREYYALGRPGVKGHGPSRIQNANAADPGGMNPVAMVGQQLDGWMFRNQGNGGLCESLFPCVRTDY